MSVSAIAWYVVLFALLFLSFKRPVYGLSLYFFTFFLHPVVWWWGDEVLDLRWNLIAACVLLVAIAYQKLVVGHSERPDSTAGGSAGAGETDATSQSRPGAPLLLAVAILANASLVHIFSADMAISLETYTLLAKFVLLFALVYAAVRTESDVRVVLWTLLLCGAYLGYEVTVNERGELTGGRLEGVGAAGVQNANQLASLLVTLLPLLGCLFFLTRFYGKLIVVPAIGLVVNVVLLCNSRGAFLAAILSAVVFLSVAPAAARKQALAGLLLACVATFVLLGDARIIERFMTTFTAEERDSSSASRLVFWAAGLRAIADYPLGSGGEAFSTYHSASYLDEGALGTEQGRNRAVHNGFLNEAIDWGVQGLALQLVLIGSLMLQVRRRLPKEGDRGTALFGAALLASTVAFLSTSVFGSYLDDEWGYWLCALMLGFTTCQWKLALTRPEPVVAAPLPAGVFRGGQPRRV